MSSHDFVVVMCIAAAFATFAVSLAGTVWYSSQR